MIQLVQHLCSLTVLLLFALCPLQAGAEESYNITLEKGGQLSKQIKKGDVLNVKLLTISGPLNNLDLELISSMSNLEELDLKDAVLSNEKPENMDNFELIHIPQGFSAAYTNLPSITVGDDIEL